MIENIVALLESSRSSLHSLLPAAFSISLLLAAASFILSFHRIREQFDVKKIIWIALAIIILIGFSLRAATPVYFVTFNDEFAHIDTGKNIVTNGKADVCAGYANAETKICHLFNEPAGFPYVIALFFLPLGISETSAYAVNLIMGSLLSIAAFLFCYLLFRSEKIGFYSAFVVSILPLFILLSRNIEPDTVSAFFALLAFSCFMLFYKIRDTLTGILAVSMLAFAVSVKQEGILLIPLVLLLSALYLGPLHIKNAIRDRRPWLLLALFLVLVIPHILHLSLELYPAMFYGKQTATAVGGKLIDLSRISTGIPLLEKATYGDFYPILINFFSIIGVIHALRKNRKEAIFLLAFFFLYNFVYFAYSGEVLEKYLITGLVPLICFAGMGMYASDEFVALKIHGIARIRAMPKKRVIDFALPLAICLVLSLLFIPYFYEISEGSKPLNLRQGYPRDLIEYKEVEAIRLVEREINSCYIIAKNPLLFSATSLKPVNTASVLNDGKLVIDVLSDGGCIFYFEDLYCTDFYSLGSRCGLSNNSVADCEELRQKTVSKCTEMKEHFRLQQYLKYRYGKFEFTLYNVTLKE